MERLNLGCGLDVRDGWTNVDREPSEPRVQRCDIAHGRLPYPDRFFDHVVVNHVLHMLTYDELPHALAEIQRVLAPRRPLRVIEGDTIKAFNAWLRRDAAWFPIDDATERTLDGKLCRYLVWHGTRRSLYTPWSMAQRLVAAGFVNVATGEHGECELDSRPEESFIVTGLAP